MNTPLIIVVIENLQKKGQQILFKSASAERLSVVNGALRHIEPDKLVSGEIFYRIFYDEPILGCNTRLVTSAVLEDLQLIKNDNVSSPYRWILVEE